MLFSVWPQPDVWRKDDLVKLYSHPVQPNAIRVLMFIDEKGLDIPVVEVDMVTGEQKSPEYLEMNPSGQVPMLEIDDGSHLTESVVICRYLDELHPEPPLFGKDIKERSVIAMWERILELGLFIPAIEYLHHTIPALEPFFDQHPDWAESLRPGMVETLKRLDAHLGNGKFVAGETFSIADITGFLGVKYAEMAAGLKPPPDGPVAEWLCRISERKGSRSFHEGERQVPEFFAAVIEQEI